MLDGACHVLPDSAAIAGLPQQHPLASDARPPLQMVPDSASQTVLP